MKNGRSTIRHAGRFIAYYRVSTAKQGASGLGLEAQGKAVADHLAATRGTLLAEFTEIESGKRTDRPELDKALSACRLHGATLLVAKLDRLARNAHFLLGLKEAGIEFVCCDMPSANRLTVGIMAMVAEEEARLISVRTKAALAAAKERGGEAGESQKRHTGGTGQGHCRRKAGEGRGCETPGDGPASVYPRSAGGGDHQLARYRQGSDRQRCADTVGVRTVACKAGAAGA